MDVASLPVQAEKRAMWARLNRLDPIRPMVWINELPWHELEGEELAARSEDEHCRGIERELRRTLYLWRHMPADMVVDPVYYSPYAYEDTGFGVDASAVRAFDDGLSVSNAADWVPLMRTEADIERIRLPVVTADWPATERDYLRTAELIGDVLPVEKRGVCHLWCAPWDYLIRWWGIEELYLDMLDRPALVHRGISRMMDALLARLDQLEAQGLLSVGDGNHRVGSGGLGITDELPQPDYDGRAPGRSISGGPRPGRTPRTLCW